jgi:hypothetical protein
MTITSQIDCNTEKGMGRNKDMGKMAEIRVETRTGTKREQRLGKEQEQGLGH